MWPLEAGASSSYSVYEDSGVSVEYQRGVFTRTPIRATQSGDTLKVEIGPVEGGFDSMLKTRAYELRLPDDWPPASVTVNGQAVAQADVQSGQAGWNFVGNTLTTVIPTTDYSTAAKVTIEVRRAPGLVGRRDELDGFAGAMTRLRGAYDAMQQTWPVDVPPDALIDVMQTGDRLGYHPERAAEEIAHFHEELPKAQAAVATSAATFSERLDSYAERMAKDPLHPANMQVEKEKRLASMARASQLVNAANP